MVLKNSIHTRIFQGSGSLHEISLLLNLFNKYNGIYNTMKIIKTQKLIYFDLIKIIKKSTSYLFQKLFDNLKSNFIANTFINFFKENESFFKKIFKFFSTISIFFLFKKKLSRNLKILFFSELKKTKNMKKNLSFYSFYGKKKHKLLFLTDNSKKNKSFLFNNKYYNYNLVKPIKNFLKTFRNKNNHNIFVTGEVFDFYDGSITPFSKSNPSWFISTGLKADVECNDLDLFKNLYTKDTTPNFYDDKIKNAIFKVLNFKTKIVSNIKQNVRQLFFYNTYQFFGFQRFFSEKMISFTLLQHEKKFHFENPNFYLNVYLNKTFQIKNFFFINKQRFRHLEIKKNYFGLFTEQTKIIFLYFKMSKSLLNFYLILSKKQESLINYSTFFYKSLILFKLVSKRFIIIFKHLFKANLILINNFYLKNYYVKSEGISKQNSKVLQSFFLNFNLTNEIIRNTLKLSFFQFFFDIFLMRKYKYFFIKKLKKILKKNLSQSKKAEIYLILAKKPYSFFVYKLFCFYFNFLIDWKLNFSILINNTSQLDQKFSNKFLILIEPFDALKRKWDYNSFTNLKELHFFFYYVLENIVLNLKHFFYFNFLLKKNINLNLKFLVSSLFIYISKLTSKDTNENYFLLNNFVKLSDFFLGKWFYYKQKNNFSNNLFDSHYNIFNPSKILNLSQKEIYIHNLLRVNFSGISIFKKLDIYLRKAAKFQNFNYKNNEKIRLKKKGQIYRYLYNPKPVCSKFTNKKFIIDQNSYKYNFMKKLRLLVIEEMLTNVQNYRTYRWSKKFSESINNPLEVGFKFSLPNIIKGKQVLKKRKFMGDFNFRFFSSIRRNFFRKKFSNIYKNKFFKRQEIVLTNTFLCIYKNFKGEKNDLYQKTLFWFNQ